MRTGLMAGCALAALWAGAALAQTRQDALPTATPIKHLVVIFNENASFDHYFATYPQAANPAGEPRFMAKAETPKVNNLVTANLLTNNPNNNAALNGADAANPFRLDRTQANPADQKITTMRRSSLRLTAGRWTGFRNTPERGTPGGPGAFGTKGQVMGYFDGNTVTALWNYAQNFALDDNAWTDRYGPSTPGALAVVSGQTDGMKIVATSTKPFVLGGSSYYIDDGAGGYDMINDVDPGYDVCSKPSDQVMMTSRNIGDLLNAAGITWGGFMGGFNLERRNPNGTTGCKRSTHSMVVGRDIVDYIPHHDWFQYLRIDGQSEASAAELGGGDRLYFRGGWEDT